MRASSRIYIYLKYFLVVIFLGNAAPALAQIEETDEETVIMRGAISLKDVDSIMKMYTYDPVSDKILVHRYQQRVQFGISYGFNP